MLLKIEKIITKICADAYYEKKMYMIYIKKNRR